MSQKKGWG